jgi:hypothetical protein
MAATITTTRVNLVKFTPAPLQRRSANLRPVPWQLLSRAERVLAPSGGYPEPTPQEFNASARPRRSLKRLSRYWNHSQPHRVYRHSYDRSMRSIGDHLVHLTGANIRPIILATTLVALAPVTFAQTFAPVATATPGQAGGTNYYASGPATPSRTAMSGQPDPQNCGTPDEPKACPPIRADLGTAAPTAVTPTSMGPRQPCSVSSGLSAPAMEGHRYWRQMD